MRFPLRTAVAAAALMVASPAIADVDLVTSSTDQGTLVHTNGEEVGSDVTGTLGAGPSAPEIVHFQGETDATTNSNFVRLQQGNGQSELTGAIFGGPNDTYNLESGDIFLSADASGSGSPDDPDNFGMTWIELAFQGVEADTVTFVLTMLGEAPITFADVAVIHDPSGENKWGFLTSNDEQILNVHYDFNGGFADALRQVRITPGAGVIPEPGTWALMLLGFGAVGYSMRRRRTRGLAQVA